MLSAIPFQIKTRSAVAALTLAVCAVSGCNTPPPPSSKPQTSKATTAVMAQGQIMPRHGILRIAATPGDIVDSIDVEIGEAVSKDQPLVVMRSAALREKQRQALEAQRRAAQEEKSQALLQAQQKVRVAQEKLANLQMREKGLPRKEKLIGLAEEQLNASRRVLQKLESISHAHLTSEFVGGLEIDRQRIAVGEADLKLQHEREAYAQAKDDLASAKRAAEIELEVANEILNSVESSSAVDVITAQIATLDQEIAASRILAPCDGVVLAINTRVGEAAAQFPLIEMADLSKMVCEVEVNEVDAARVSKGDRAKIKSRAFSDTLEGEVISISSLVGRPKLRPLDPLARTDFRSVTTVIALDDSSLVSNWLQLRVQAEIDTHSGDSAEVVADKKPEDETAESEEAQ